MIDHQVLLSGALALALLGSVVLGCAPHRVTHGHKCETCDRHAKEAAEARVAAEERRRAKEHGYFHRAYPMVEIGDVIRCLHCKQGIPIEP